MATAIFLLLLMLPVSLMKINKKVDSQQEAEKLAKNELRQKEVLKRLDGWMETQHIMTIAFEIA